VIRGAGRRTSRDPWMGEPGGERVLVSRDDVIMWALLSEGCHLQAKAFFYAFVQSAAVTKASRKCLGGIN
jgi:hypothetical protein